MSTKPLAFIVVACGVLASLLIALGLTAAGDNEVVALLAFAGAIPLLYVATFAGEEWLVETGRIDRMD